MTLQGAIQQLYDMRCNEKFPIYYKPAIDEVIKTIVADAQEVRRGRWTYNANFAEPPFKCSACGKSQGRLSNYCPNCGADMRGEEE